MSLVRTRVLPRLAAALVLVVLARGARADAPRARETDVLLEVDPATFAWGGFSAHARLRPDAWPSWSFGAGVYAMDMPSFLVDLDPANRGKSWDARIRLGAALFVDRFLGEAPRGPFVGLELGVQRMRLENPHLGPGTAQYSALLAMPRAGYLWQPFGSGFYLMPWLGIGVAQRIAGSAELAGEPYHVPRVPMFATLHAGWRL